MILETAHLLLLPRFDFAASPVDEALIRRLATSAFTDTAHNIVLIGGTGTGNDLHWADSY